MHYLFMMTNVFLLGIRSLFSIPTKQSIPSNQAKVKSSKRQHPSTNKININHHSTCMILIVLLSLFLVNTFNTLSIPQTVSAFPAFSNRHFLSVTKTTRMTIASSTTTPAATTSTSSETVLSSKVTTGFDIHTLPIDTLAATANAYASANGVQVETTVEGTTSSYFQTAPISLLPNAYPKDEFQKAINVAPLFNLLVDRVSHDPIFLQETLGGSVSDADPYTGKLLKLYNEIYLDSSTATIDDNTSIATTFAKQADALGIFRSDYMLSRSSNEDGDENYHIKQVELNTIASSFAGLASKVARLHTYLVERYSPESTPLQSFLKLNQQIVTGTSNAQSDNGVPINPTLDKLPEAFHVAIERYKERFVNDSNNTNDIIVLFVVQPNERNTVDQRMLEFALYDKYKIRIVRKSLADIHTNVQLNPETGAITIDGTDQEIAIVYYRAGYAPTDYPSGIDGIEWIARKKLELSRATKCPNLGYHLAGTKKVQQALARPGAIEKYFTTNNDDDDIIVSKLRATFAGLYSLDLADITESDYKVIDQILNTEKGRELFVLKPQREGGGYNFYGTNLYNKLRDNVQNNTKTDGTSTLILSKELGEYILMERLFPPQQQGILLRGGKMEGIGDTISELGCFGCIVSAGDGTTVFHNEYAGFLLRTKFSNVDEGGVASGFATLSSPYLC